MIFLLIESTIMIISDTKYYNTDEIQSLNKLNDATLSIQLSTSKRLIISIQRG